tara:strand:- start:326 stop:1837 length:1512 start_codon:yes stop_codon:yes gene_type:complete
MKYIISIILLLSIIYPKRDYDISNSHCLDDNRSCAQRPNLDYHTLSPSGHFMIHYNHYYDGIDNYANEVALSADSSRKMIVDIMNFRSEISDEDGIYDIYIKELPNGSYGWNCPSNDVGSSWIEIDDNYIGSNYSTSGEDAMRISVAHEFFHAIQRAYISTPGSNSFFYELSSMWIEDIIYPDINDYITFSEFGDDYFSNPDRNMNEYNGYGLGLYPHYMNFIFDNQIMQRIWEQLSIDLDVFNAIDNILNDNQHNYNSSFTETWLDFNTRNLFNGLFSDMNNEIYYYEDQSLFNPIHTSPLDINQYLESSADEWEIFEYQTSVNNRSVKIRSFQPSQDNTQEFLFNVDQNNAHSSFSLISGTDGYTTVLSNTTNLNYILDHNDIFHFLYISNDSSGNVNTVIQKRDKQSSYSVDYYPNPINIGQNLTLKFSSVIEIKDFKVDILNFRGQLIEKFDFGSFAYNGQDFNEISFSPFNSIVSSGVYFLKIYLDDYIISEKIIYLK